MIIAIYELINLVFYLVFHPEQNFQDVFFLFSVPLAALQHYLYCPRQCALIHLECAWADNQFTAEGNVFHERADSGMTETAGERGSCVLFIFLPSNGEFTALRMSWRLFMLRKAAFPYP